jgi:purine-nucleoside phosphorylase
MLLPDFIDETAAWLQKNGIPKNIEAAVILGSGLGSFAHQIEKEILPYSHIPHFPEPSVEGHKGQLICGKIGDKKIIAFSGRFHHYEGYTFEQAAIPVYVAKALKARKLIISNAAGAINTHFQVGDLMIIDSVMRQNMAISPKASEPLRYNHYPIAVKARKLAADLNLPIKQGTYLYAKGPNYETKAEIRAFRVMGADAVGMSTAPELFEAAKLKLKTVAISLISNMAAGLAKQPLGHHEVKRAAKNNENDFAKLVKKLILEL